MSASGHFDRANTMNTDAFRDILYEKTESSGIVVVTLNTPKRKNALRVRTFLELFQAVEAMEKDTTATAMILTGANNPEIKDPRKQAFSAGAYFKAGKGFLGHDDASLSSEEKTQIDFTDIAQKKLTLKLWQFDKPVVAAMNGYAIGAGFTMLLAGADFIFAADHAWAWLPFAQLAILPEFASTFLLPRLLGFQKAKEILFLGEKMPAQQMLDLGLVNKLLPHDELIPFSRHITSRLIPPKGAGLAVKKIKNALHRPLIDELSRALDKENKEMNEAFASADYLEAISARYEQREPRFKGE